MTPVTALALVSVGVLVNAVSIYMLSRLVFRLIREVDKMALAEQDW